MIVTVNEFRSRVESDLDSLVSDLELVTGRSNPEERQAWRTSLPSVSRAFRHPTFANLHLYFGGRGNLSLEYQLPGSFSWADMVLLGRHNGRRSAVFVELKNWQTRNDQPGETEGLMQRHTGSTLHPSEQVRGYAEYSQEFHSAVQDYDAGVHGCVLFTADRWCGAYREEPNTRLSREYPLFTTADEDTLSGLPAFFADRLTEPDEAFAMGFEAGVYRQDRNFCRQIANQILHPDSKQFVLLDNQRYAFAKCWEHIQQAIFRSESPRPTAIIIDGPPGSGKSVIAARLWAFLVRESRLQEGNVVVVTTSQAQNSNWSYLFRTTAGRQAAQGAIIKANSFYPCSASKFNNLAQQFGFEPRKAQAWRENVAFLRNASPESQMPDRHMLVSIVDEAHALINPEHSDGRGQFGFDPRLGPQAWQIIRGSVVSIFLLDSKQAFRDRENTTVADIKFWATGLGAETPDTISLHGSQFRCQGSKDYADWIEAFLSSASCGEISALARRWHRPAATLIEFPEPQPAVADEKKPYLTNRHRSGTAFDFRVYDDPHDMEHDLRARIATDVSGRLAASYSVPWTTQGAPHPHDLPPEAQDFHLDTPSGKWSRVWNQVVNGNNYSQFIQGAPGSRIAKDQLAEVGCTYAIRGFDFDYLGILWLHDLVWRDGRWATNIEHIHESGLSRAKSRAGNESSSDGPAHQFLTQKLQEAYRILFTRAIKGVAVYVADRETREHLMEALG